MSIPYMGSKQGIVDDIYSEISKRHNKGVLVDLFAGGGSVTERFARSGWSVIANDGDKYTAAILRKVYVDGIKESEMSQFVTRSMFEVGATTDWEAGFYNAIYSFSSTGKSYLYSKSSEGLKMGLHNLIVNRDPSKLLSVNPKLKPMTDMIVRLPNRQLRRQALKKVAKTFKVTDRIEHLERIERIDKTSRLGLNNIAVSNKDYRDVFIPDGAVVYCDPPYGGTAEYNLGGFDTEKFWEWAREKSKTNPVYVSEYSHPRDFVPVLSVGKSVALGAKRSTASEKLVVYRDDLNTLPNVAGAARNA